MNVSPYLFQPASALDSTTEAIGLFDPVSLDLRPRGGGFQPYNFLHQNHHETKKNTKGCFIVWFQGAPSQWTSLLPQSSEANFDTPKKANKSLTGKKVSEAASLRTKGGVTTSTSDVKQLTLHFAHDLPLWHILLTNMPQLLLLTSISVAKAKPHQGLSKLQRCKALGTNLPTLLLRDQFAQQTHPEVCHDHKSEFKSRSS